MAEYAARIATASGDAGALLSLCIELAQEVSKLSAEAAILQGRRAKDAARKRNPPRKSADVHGVHRNGAEPLPPQVSPSFPTPHITPSSPPIPLLPPAPPEAEELRLVERAPEFWPVAVEFLAGKEPTARTAWIGRFHGALDRPPHPTPAELRDALQDLMTRPREEWKPILFRRYVERIRREESDATARQVERTHATNGAGEAGTMFAKIRSLVKTVEVIGQPTRRYIPRAAIVALGEQVAAAYDAIGGADRFLNPAENVGFVLRDFTREYGTQNGAHV